MSGFRRIFAMTAVALTLAITVADVAEARRAGGGGFGSRGTRTYSAPPATQTAPSGAQGINRSMTPDTGPAAQPGMNRAAPGMQQTQQAARPGFFGSGGFGRSMIGGLVAGGLLGMMLGHGFGGGFGFLGLLLQMVLIGGGIMLLMRFLARGRQQPGYAGSAPANPGRYDAPVRMAPSPQAATSASLKGGLGRGVPPAAAAATGTDEVGLTGTDFDRFEAMLAEVQKAYGVEDYATLRALTTPEAMSYLAEELSDNATSGVRNEVSGVRLLQGDLAEAWREGDADYATVAMRYESVDVMRDRASGRVVEGDPARPTEATEIWTFLRKRGERDWRVSAIQDSRAA
ncbi:hypothetical protein BJF93_06680 [Xaviernesmea oryzae]|uniref:Tim44-like domain-containing protein n=1 Tax=Xaviernesmea oryzae TaxID=464029 RepID=A0A1Q9AS73_9HYPH|nr:Tim44 domain-containing protein [Xaviernesmea oryzae]OLP58292.1 hypothetical protein BJF93_06680 [Xaviernesmea oryzae]SEL43127.1 Predicted lipid-binding transport protein, Tim44 family [Xaviernesmea oryzae]